jgi:hypothetical protein
MEITYRHTHVGTIEFATDSSAPPPTALKGFDTVTLGIPLQFHLEGCAANQRWMLSNLNVELRTQSPGLQNLLASGIHVETLMPATGALKLSRLVNVRCSPRALLQYEASRDGAPILFRCELRGTIYGLLQMNGRECLSDPSPTYGWVDFEFPKHAWASMLRNCELSASVFVEIPLPSGPMHQLDDSHRALLDAFEAFEHGGATAWKDSVGHIRPYLEAWSKQQPLPSTQPPKDGSKADREWKLLNLRDALYKCCHVLVHSPKSSCTRKDALLILNTFARLLEVRP